MSSFKLFLKYLIPIFFLNAFVFWSSQYYWHRKATPAPSPTETTAVKAKEKEATDLLPSFCGKNIETNDYNFGVKCVSFPEQVRVGNISVIGDKILLLTQNAKVHIFDTQTNSYIWSASLDLANFNRDFAYGAAAKGIFWADKSTFIVSYISQGTDCFQPYLAEFSGLDLTNSRNLTAGKTLTPTKIHPLADCVLQSDNPDFNGIGGAFLRMDEQSFLLSVGAPEATSANIRKNAQILGSPMGKVLHFRKTAGSWIGGKPKVFTMGHRNPQGLTRFPNGDIFSTEHGPKGGDEINQLRNGGNYGWPKYSFGMAYSTDPLLANIPYLNPQDSTRYQAPTFYFSPSIGICGIYAMKQKFFDRWRDTLLVASLRNMSLHIVKLNSSHEKVLSDEIVFFERRLRTVTAIGNTIYVFGENAGVYILTPQPWPEDKTKAI